MGDLPLRTPNDRRLGGPLPRRPANHTHAHPFPSLFITSPCGHVIHTVLGRISPGYPPERDRLHTRYSPVRRSPSTEASFRHAAPRLACVRPVASVHPEPGSNSSLYISAYNLFFSCQDGIVSFNIGSCPLTWTTSLQCVPVLHLLQYRIVSFDVDHIFTMCSCTTSFVSFPVIQRSPAPAWGDSCT